MLTSMAKMFSNAATAAPETMFMLFEGDSHYPRKYTQDLAEFKKFVMAEYSHKSAVELDVIKDPKSFDVFIVTIK